jgi:hypothetical protein
VSADWQYVRETTNHFSHGPVTNVTDPQLLCYELAGRPAANVSTVKAGDTIGFTISPDMQHPGPGNIYMAKVPAGSDVTTWEPTGDKVWFKVCRKHDDFGRHSCRCRKEELAWLTSSTDRSDSSHDQRFRIAMASSE